MFFWGRFVFAYRLRHRSSPNLNVIVTACKLAHRGRKHLGRRDFLPTANGRQSIPRISRIVSSSSAYSFVAFFELHDSFSGSFLSSQLRIHDDAGAAYLARLIIDYAGAISVTDRRFRRRNQKPGEGPLPPRVERRSIRSSSLEHETSTTIGSLRDDYPTATETPNVFAQEPLFWSPRIRGSLCFHQPIRFPSESDDSLRKGKEEIQTSSKRQ